MQAHLFDPQGMVQDLRGPWASDDMPRFGCHYHGRLWVARTQELPCTWFASHGEHWSYFTGEDTFQFALCPEQPFSPIVACGIVQDMLVAQLQDGSVYSLDGEYVRKMYVYRGSAQFERAILLPEFMYSMQLV